MLGSVELFSQSTVAKSVHIDSNDVQELTNHGIELSGTVAAGWIRNCFILS